MPGMSLEVASTNRRIMVEAKIGVKGSGQNGRRTEQELISLCGRARRVRMRVKDTFWSGIFCVWPKGILFRFYLHTADS